jgi:hypothetical protein
MVHARGCLVLVDAGRFVLRSTAYNVLPEYREFWIPTGLIPRRFDIDCIEAYTALRVCFSFPNHYIFSPFTIDSNCTANSSEH